MSLVNLSHVCSHLQNASKARLGLTSIPHSNLHLKFMLSLHKSGFISTVTLGDLSPPPPSHLMAHPEGEEYRHPEITQENRSTRRLWVGLKYWNNEPVLSKLNMISKPTRRIWMGVEDFRILTNGERKGYVKGLRGIGECVYVSTDRGVMEIRECVERSVGGMLLCRVL